MQQRLILYGLQLKSLNLGRDESDFSIQFLKTLVRAVPSNKVVGLENYVGGLDGGNGISEFREVLGYLDLCGRGGGGGGGGRL